MKKILLSFLFMLTASMLLAQAPLLKTTVAQGEIEGEDINGFAVYKAIPYAEPPVGELRWKAPVPKKPWTGVYKASDYAARPPQPADPNHADEVFQLSEDCLYLLVQTPAKSKDEKLPVFVMIHGGAFVSGTYAGLQENFAREGIVYVSIEYRLGVLGFLAHPELTKESAKETGRSISGNYGIQDQILALKWIHDNIASFGGDPDKVTICGESAGGISVSMLCASPLCKGLFRGAISESGSSFWPVAESRGGNTAMCNLAGGEKSGIEYLKKVGAKNIKELRKMDFNKIVAANQSMDGFWPIVDGYSIVDDQYKLYEKGDYNDVNILIGTNSDEGWMFSFPAPQEMFEAQMRNTYGSFADRLLKIYPTDNEYGTKGAMANIFRDGSFAWGTYAWANLQTKTGKGKVYMYYFDQCSKNMFVTSPRGAIHVAEMPFIYNWNWGPMTTTEQRMWEIMPKYWINFTKTGDPNGEGIPYWTPYEKDKETVMTIRNGFYLTKVHNQEQMDFFEDFFRDKRSK